MTELQEGIPSGNTNPVRECTFLASPRKVPKEGDLRGHCEKACPLKKPLRRLAGQRPKMFRFLNAYISKCRRDDFRSFGASVELFKGVREWFSLVNEYGRQKGVRVEHYINSSGLAEMIEGTEIAHEFKRIFACSFLYNKDGEAE